MEVFHGLCGKPGSPPGLPWEPAHSPLVHPSVLPAGGATLTPEKGQLTGIPPDYTPGDPGSSRVPDKGHTPWCTSRGWVYWSVVHLVLENNTIISSARILSSFSEALAVLGLQKSIRQYIGRIKCLYVNMSLHNYRKRIQRIVIELFD